MGYVIAPSPRASVEVRGTGDRYPVHRIIHAGTPAGVGALKSGDRIEAGIEGLDSLVRSIA